MDSGLSKYRQRLDALFARTGTTSRFGLERTIELMELAGNPHRRIATIHVAGTNGKGSVVAMLYSMLRAGGHRVGRYTSPHLIDFRERIVVDDRPIDEGELIAFLDAWEPAAERIGATFFEITTAMALDHFARHEVDIAVIETGLGGRLDATNVVRPVAAGITSIALDHQEYLGDTEAKIAREKAGIFKPGVPAVIGAMSDEARDAACRVAAEVGASVIVDVPRRYPVGEVTVSSSGTSFIVEHAGEECRMQTPLIGAPQAGNAALAIAMLRAAGPEWSLSLEEASESLGRVRLPGRFHRLGNCILDVAHNPDGVATLVATLHQVNPAKPVVALLGVLADKDWRGMMLLLRSAVDRMILVAPPSAPVERAWRPEEALEFARAHGIAAAVARDFNAVVRKAVSLPGTAVITGSFHTVGDALQVLGADSLKG